MGRNLRCRGEPSLGSAKGDFDFPERGENEADSVKLEDWRIDRSHGRQCHQGRSCSTRPSVSCLCRRLLLSVLISSVTNLLSNGIRFTSTSQVRKIELRWDLSFDPPLPGTCVMPRLPEPSPLLKDDMEVYLYVAVTDTGPGLTPKELDMLFQRFSQVSRKYPPHLAAGMLSGSQDTHHLWRVRFGAICLQE